MYTIQVVSATQGALRVTSLKWLQLGTVGKTMFHAKGGSEEPPIAQIQLTSESAIRNSHYSNTMFKFCTLWTLLIICNGRISVAHAVVLQPKFHFTCNLLNNSHTGEKHIPLLKAHQISPIFFFFLPQNLFKTEILIKSMCLASGFQPSVNSL